MLTAIAKLMAYALGIGASTYGLLYSAGGAIEAWEGMSTETGKTAAAPTPPSKEAVNS